SSGTSGLPALPCDSGSEVMAHHKEPVREPVSERRPKPVRYMNRSTVHAARLVVPVRRRWAYIRLAGRWVRCAVAPPGSCGVGSAVGLPEPCGVGSAVGLPEPCGVGSAVGLPE